MYRRSPPSVVATARALVTSVALLLAACGDKGQALKRDDPQAVCKAVLVALAEQDLSRVRLLMTQRCWAGFEHEMELFRAHLSQPDSGGGQEVHRIGKQKLGDEWPAAVEQAAAGGTAKTWSLIQRLQPMPNPPQMAGVLADLRGLGQLKLFYVAPSGIRKPIYAERIDGLWSVSYVALY